MLKRGQLNCVANQSNVGFGSCFLDWKIIKGAFLYENPRTFTDAEIANMQATLAADAANDTKANRCFPIHNFVGPVDNSEAVVIQTFDYGLKAVTRDGDYDWSFQYTTGGACLQNALRTHNGGGKNVLFYDKENKLLGWGKSTGFSTIPLQFFYADPFKLATGAAVAQYLARFEFLPKYANEEADFIKLDFDPTEITGMQDIKIIQNTWNQNTGLTNVTLELVCGGDNVYDLYSADIVAGLFQAYDDEGNAITVTGVTPQAGTKTFNIQLNAGQLPDSGNVTLSGKSISSLVAHGIIGFEIGSTDLVIAGS